MRLLGEEYINKEKYSPELLVTEKIPMAFIWHTAEDKTVSAENSLRYVAALTQKGVLCELHVFPLGRHGLALSLDNEHVAQWKRLLDNWLELNGWI